jgi:hypothetical protein
MNIVQAIHDDRLFKPFFGDLTTWSSWLAAVKVLYGLELTDAEAQVVRDCTGRDPAKLPSDGFRTSLFLIGRRSGKSRVAAAVGAYEAALCGHEKKLAPGERGIVPIVAPSKPQARIVLDYVRAVFATPLLAGEVANETKDGLELKSGTRIEVMAGHFRTSRGFTLLAAVIEECAFFGLDEESKIKSDAELIRAVKPGLATTQGRLVAITSPYARRGWTYKTYKAHHGNDRGRTLVWNTATRVMNPTLAQAEVDEAMAEDPAAARSEWHGEFRDDVCAFIGRELVEDLVVKGRTQLPPVANVRYTAFVDPSGGRNDSMTCCVAHKEGRVVVADLLLEYRPPFDPHDVVTRIAREVKAYGVEKVTGDNFGADWVARCFITCGLRYTKSDKPKSGLYTELLPRLTSREVELPDNPRLVDQLAGLERRVRAGGRDVIDHAPGGHDDLSNALAGAAVAAFKTIIVGPLGYDNSALTSRFDLARQYTGAWNADRY